MRWPRIIVGVAVTALLVAASSASAAKPLRLNPTPSRPVEAGRPPLPTVFDARYVVAREKGSETVRVTDDRTAGRYEVRASPSCIVFGLRFPELLLNCGALFSSAGPLIVNLQSGGRQTFPGDSDERDFGPTEPDQLGWEEDDSYSEVGSRWLGGRWADITGKTAGGAAYLDRQTGRRVTRPNDLQYDLDSTNLAPARQACRGPGRPGRVSLGQVEPSARSWLRSRPDRPGPGFDLLLERCGRPAQVISRCPSSCYETSLTNRFVTWVSRSGFNVRSRRTGRAYTLRLAPNGAQPTITAVTDRRALVAFYRFAHRPANDGYRVTEIPLP